MTTRAFNRLRPQTSNGASHTRSPEQRRQRILKVAGEQFAAAGPGFSTWSPIAKAAGIAEAMLSVYFGTKEEFFQEVIERNMRDRLAALRERFALIPDMPPLERIESMAESTVLVCVGDVGNASVMARALLEMPEFAAEIYRTEIGASEALWNTEIATRLADSPLRTRVAVHLVPYSVHACMAFGLWLATLRHKPATAQAHERQYAEGVVHVARALLTPPESVDRAATCQLPSERDFADRCWRE